MYLSDHGYVRCEWQTPFPPAGCTNKRLGPVPTNSLLILGTRAVSGQVTDVRLLGDTTRRPLQNYTSTDKITEVSHWREPDSMNNSRLKSPILQKPATTARYQNKCLTREHAGLLYLSRAVQLFEFIWHCSAILFANYFILTSIPQHKYCVPRMYYRNANLFLFKVHMHLSKI